MNEFLQIFDIEEIHFLINISFMMDMIILLELELAFILQLMGESKDLNTGVPLGTI